MSTLHISFVLLLHVVGEPQTLSSIFYDLQEVLDLLYCVLKIDFKRKMVTFSLG